MKLTQDKLKELLDYNPETGVFIWKVNKGNNAIAGNIAGFKHKHKGYWHIKINNKSYKAHRLAFLWMEGYFPENCVDHIDRDKSNNKWNNLREVSISCNNKNCNIYKTNTSGITGVHFYKKYKKWLAYIVFNSKTKNLGYFDELKDAAKARWEAEVKYKYPDCSTISSAYNYLKEHRIL